MRHLGLLLLPTIFGMVYAGSSGEQNLDYNPLAGPPQSPNGPLVSQNHGAIGDPVGAKAGIEQGGNSNGVYDYPLYDGPPAGAQGPGVSQQHGYNGAPQVIPAGAGGNSNDNDGYYGAAMGGQAAAGDSSNSIDGAGGGAGAGGSPFVSNTGGNPAPVEPNPVPVAGGGIYNNALSQNQPQAQTASAMSGGAVAGVVIGVAALGAVGAGVAVYLVRSGSSSMSPA